jgi:hypothetical protein
MNLPTLHRGTRREAKVTIGFCHGQSWDKRLMTEGNRVE